MLSFKRFMVEYLTDEQRKRYSGIKMTDKARSDTDHFFGAGNDLVHGEISDDAGHLHDKSEIHKAVERHLGVEIPHENYRSGIHPVPDKYGRPVKIGKAITDPKLKNAFASDRSREGSKKGSTFRTSTVRGTEVAGQTNNTPNAQHPKGHSWGDLSCKNVDSGSNRRYLENEIKHGTVVHRVHDHNGQEIYRATLQPHHDEHGNVAYALNSEYGIKHPAFTKSAEDVANRLSGEYKPSTYKIVSKVYNDKDNTYILHPNMKSEHIDKALEHDDPKVRIAAASNPNATAAHIHKALEHDDPEVRIAAASNPNASSENIHKALKDKDRYVRLAAIQHPNATAWNIDKALEDKNGRIRHAAIRHPNASSENIYKALDDEHPKVRVAAIQHPNATAAHIDKALEHDDPWFRSAAIEHPNSTKEHIAIGLNDKHPGVRATAKRIKEQRGW